MKIKKILITFLLISALTFSFSFVTSFAYAANDVFEDNFDNYPNGSFPTKWQNIPNYWSPQCPEEWTVDNGKLKISISNRQSCTTNIKPTDASWGNIGDTYILEADMYFKAGADHNIVYKGNSSLKYFYELHFQSPRDFTLGYPMPGDLIYTIAHSYPNEQKYNIKAVVDNTNIKIYINNILVRHAILENTIPSGRIWLRAGVGGNPISETWFDNIKVTEINHNAFKHFMQNDESWGDDIYDHALDWDPTNPYIKNYGCALTSAAMILNFHGYKLLPNNEELNPQTLNNWLINHDAGFVKNGLVSWQAITKVSELSKMINELEHDALEFEWINSNNLDSLSNELENGNPVIGEIKTGPQSSHFIVIDEEINSDFSVKDPLHDYSLLSEYGDSFKSMRVFRPSNTDLSFIQLIADDEIDINVTNETTGESIGEIVIQNPLENDLGEGTSGSPKKYFLLHKPSSNNYQVTISSDNNRYYNLDAYMYDVNANVLSENFIGLVSADNNDTYILSFDKDNSNNSIMHLVNSSFNLDLIAQYNLNEFRNKGTYNSFFAKYKAYLKKGKNIKSLQNFAETQNNKSFDQKAYQVILSNIDLLK